jgi:hypothetical protein
MNNLNPQVGMGGTVQHLSDRYPFTVVAVRRRGKEIVIRRDKAIPKKAGGYIFELRASEDEETITLRSDGSFRKKGSSIHHLPRYDLGERHYYRSREI